MAYGIVYLIENRINGKAYVGITVRTLAKRWTSHVCDSARYTWPLSNAIRKWGADAWDMEVLQTCETAAELKAAERYWIAKLGTHVSTGDGYNVSLGGDGTFGVPCSEQRRARCREVNLGKRMSAETRAKIRAANLGKRSTPESREKASAALRGRRKAPATIAKRLATLRARKFAGQLGLFSDEGR